MALISLNDFGSNIQNQSFTIPEGTNYMYVYLTGGGGAGDFGRNNKGGAGGGRGAIGVNLLAGDLAGKTVTINVGTGGAAPSVYGYGNVGLPSSVTFDNDFMLIAGGGMRAQGDYAGQGGNMALSGSIPSYVTQFSQHNLAGEIGQNSVGGLGGIGGGNGDCGAGGNGGNTNSNGTGGIGGFISIHCFS